MATHTQNVGTALSINLNKIALIRNSRNTAYPSVTEHAEKVLNAGAQGITIHPRPDQRHIRAKDCFELDQLLTAKYPSIELNIEGNPFAGPVKSALSFVGDYPGFMSIIRDIRPAQCTLVPDGDDQLTSDHGFDLHKSASALRPIIDECHELGVRVSLFMDPTPEQIAIAKDINADRIELYTGPYADAYLRGEYQAVLAKFSQAAKFAQELGIGVNAGHDLNLHNLAEFVQAAPNVLEVSIGHAFTVDCIELGLNTAVAEYLKRLTAPTS